MWMGIDPGLTGAIAYLDSDGRVTTYRLPVYKVIKTKKQRSFIDGHMLRQMLEAAAMFSPVCCVLEDVGGITGQSASAAFNFGFSCGRIAEAIESAGIPLLMVRPQEWRAKTGVYSHSRQFPTGDTKDASRAVATALWRLDADQWIKKGDDGRCEAALMAEYGRRSLNL